MSFIILPSQPLEPPAIWVDGNTYQLTNANVQFTQGGSLFQPFAVQPSWAFYDPINTPGAVQVNDPGSYRTYIFAQMQSPTAADLIDIGWASGSPVLEWPTYLGIGNENSIGDLTTTGAHNVFVKSYVLTDVPAGYTFTPQGSSQSGFAAMNFFYVEILKIG